MNSNSDDHIDERMTSLLSVAGRDAASPDEAFLERLREQSTETYMAASATEPAQSRRYRLMHSKQFKWFTTAAAAAVILMVINFWPGAEPNGIAWADVVRHIQAARGITCEVTTYKDGEFVLSGTAMQFEPGRTRQTMPGGAVMIMDQHKGKSLTLVPASKTAVMMNITGQSPDQPKEDLLSIFQDLQKEAGELLGEQEMDGKTVIGFKTHVPGADWTIWADPETGMPVRAECEMEMFGEMKVVMSDFDFDAELDESLFSITPPEDYTLLETQIDASQPTEQDLLDTLRLFAEQAGSRFPKELNLEVMVEEITKHRVSKPSTLVDMAELTKIGMEMGQMMAKFMRGLMFVQQLHADSDWHYFGEGIKLGDANQAVCWYRPEGSESYRVIYGDLSIGDVAGEDLPQAPE
jgi:outer membrane lipoprotein-sorting protein